MKCVLSNGLVNILCVLDVLSSLFGSPLCVSSEMIFYRFLSNIYLSSLLEQMILLPNDRVTCVRYFQAAFNGTRGRERTVLDLGKVLNGQGTSLLPCPRNYSRNRMFSPELKWKADTTKALNEEIIDSLAPGTEGIAYYLDFSKNWLCLLAGGPTILWKLLSMLTIELPNSLLLSNSFKMNNLDLSVIPFRELSVVRMYFRSSFLSISINQYDWGKYDILMEISTLHCSFHIIRLVIFRLKNLGLIFSQFKV